MNLIDPEVMMKYMEILEVCQDPGNISPHKNQDSVFGLRSARTQSNTHFLVGEKNEVTVWN